jgi:hypothetical protein
MSKMEEIKEESLAQQIPKQSNLATPSGVTGIGNDISILASNSMF